MHFIRKSRSVASDIQKLVSSTSSTTARCFQMLATREDQAIKAIEPECVVAAVCRGYVAYVVGVDFESDTIEKWQKDPEKRDLADLGFRW